MVGRVRHPAAQTSVCSASRTSLKMGSERFKVRRKERAARCAGQSAFSIARTGRSPARAGLVSASVVGSSGPGARSGSVKTTGGFWTAMVL
jgi:hypothetical protein